ncbi:MAG: class I SAM-dependent methyltransferase [bacterium]
MVSNNCMHYEQCHICCARKVAIINEFADLHRVTSDCRPWMSGGKLGVCKSCGCVQKIIDKDFLRDSNMIYNSYSVYHQAAGEEQRTFEQSHGQSHYRSELILTEVLKEIDLPSKGRLLDIGCGNGNLFRSFLKVRPLWTFVGSEVNEKSRCLVKQIQNVETCYSGDVEEIPGTFDMISMIHCLEHIMNPEQLLTKLHDKINPEGVLLLEVPDYTQNPFDLIIADHCSHFTLETLKQLFHHSGFTVIRAKSNYIAKELTFLVQKSTQRTNRKREKRDTLSSHSIVKTIQWLQDTIHEALTIAQQGRFGLFGTSIAGVWLYGNCGDAVTFFVDEDPSRIEREFMGRTVYHPKDVPEGWNVFLAVPYPIAKKIWERMQSFHARFYLPPEFPEQGGGINAKS